MSLAGCTGAPLVGLEVSEYRATFNATGDEQILVNILRAKDSAPIHFAELQSIGASDQLTASLQATDPIGQLHGSTTRAGLQGTASVQATPTFSLTTLESQQFTQGLLNPVAPAIIQQLLEEGVDKSLILILFFSGYTKNGITHLNNTRCDPSEPEDCYRHLYDYLHDIDDISRKNQKIVAHTYVELTPIGAPVSWSVSTGVKDIASIDTTKYRVERDPSDPTRAIVYSVSDARLALCYVERRSTGSAIYSPIVDAVNPRVCTRDRVHVSPYRNDTQSTNGLIVRSTYQIIEFLGQVLSFQEKQREQGKDRCLTLTGIAGHRTCGDDVLFQVNPPKGSPLVTTSYQGTPYTIALDPCRDRATCDHSAEVLKIVNLLININKSAANIPQVPTVRVIQ